MIFAEVIDLYLDSPDYARLSDGTRYNYRMALDLAGKGLGFLSVDEIRPKLVQEYLDGLAGYPGKQRIAKYVIKAVESWAVVRDLIPRDITKGTKIVGVIGGHEPWTDEQVATAEDHAASHLSRVISLAVSTGQRGSDVIKMRWADISVQEGMSGIAVTQRKTGRRLWVPILPDLAAKMAKWDRDTLFIIMAPDGRPYLRNRLSHDWTIERETNAALKEHKAAKLTLHGLRSTAVVRLRRAGATELEISSMVGMSEPMVARYSRLANQNKLAMKAAGRLIDIKALREKSNQNNGRT